MQLKSLSFEPGQLIPGEYAFAVLTPDGPVLSSNRNPGFEWSDPPAGTRSFSLLCVDADAPSVGDDVNQEDREVPADLPRTDFVHWVLVDIPGDVSSIGEAEFCDGVTPGGKDATPREGVNDYTSWFTGDPEMEGRYRGYDGPGPPWNDSVVHRYHFTLYALDVESLGLKGAFTADDALAAMAGHVLGEASVTGLYTLNRRLLEA